MGQTKVQKEAAAAKKRSEASKKAAATRKANEEQAAAEAKANEEKVQAQPTPPEQQSPSADAPIESSDPDQTQDAEPVEDQSAKEPLEPYSPQHRPLQNAGLDQVAAEAQRQAELAEEREEHNERTGGFSA